MSKYIPNENRQKAHELLVKNNWRLQCGCKGPNSLLEFYCGPNGVVILQSFDDRKSINMFADWPIGGTWEETEAALKPSPSGTPQRVLPFGTNNYLPPEA